MASSAMGTAEERSEPRDTVHYRTRAAHPDGRSLPLVIVNTSAAGLMARCEAACEPGERLRLALPHVGAVVAEIRWALGGRIGCRLEHAMGLADYHSLLVAMRG